MSTDSLRTRWMAALGVAAIIVAGTALMLKPRVPAGQTANFNFVLKDMDGRDVRLSDFKGRPVLINFWATWCAPCRHEIPVFVELVEKYKAQGFVVLGISTDDEAEDLRTFAKEYKMNYPVLVGLGRDDVSDAYELGLGIPVSWFIKRDGTVYLKHTGTASRDWFEEKIKATF